jgi:preprotein translocase subunit SecD
MPLKYRVLTIVGLVPRLDFLPLPRNVTTRERGADGLLHDVTVRHVPLQRGLDLKGGTYLALEVDDSKQVIPKDKKVEAIDRALKTVRSRIEGFGVSEAIVQKQGDDRIVVNIPGEQDPERARKLVEAQAFLEFKITDKSQGARTRVAEARPDHQAARTRCQGRHVDPRYQTSERPREPAQGRRHVEEG